MMEELAFSHAARPVQDSARAHARQRIEPAIRLLPRRVGQHRWDVGRQS